MSKKRKYIVNVLCAIFVLAFIIGLIAPRLGRVQDYVYRDNSLRIWRDKVLTYEKEAGHLPKNLYEVYLYYKDRDKIESFPVVLGRQLSDEEKERLNRDTSVFLELICYEYKQDANHWYVKETKSHKYHLVFSINDLGAINQVKRSWF